MDNGVFLIHGVNFTEGHDVVFVVAHSMEFFQWATRACQAFHDAEGLLGDSMKSIEMDSQYAQAVTWADFDMENDLGDSSDQLPNGDLIVSVIPDDPFVLSPLLPQEGAKMYITEAGLWWLFPNHTESAVLPWLRIHEETRRLTRARTR